MPKITPSKRNKERETIVVKTQPGRAERRPSSWWKAGTQDERASGMIDTASYLKEQLGGRVRQMGVYARLYSNQPLFGPVGTNFSKLTSSNNLPTDRPTMNVIQSCVDTLISRITQSRTRPVFLTDGGDSKARKLAKQMNNFILGEFHQTHAYQLGKLALRDASAFSGTGCLYVYAGQDEKVCVERVLATELLVDPQDSLYGEPRQLYRLKLVDRSVLAEMFPDKRGKIDRAEQAFTDSGKDSSKTVTDQVMVVEGWHLKSGPDATDGKHMIACSDGLLSEEEYDRDKFPFVFVHYTPRLLGFWGQSLAEQLMGTQIEINKLLKTISDSINLVGVPRVFVEDGSKVVKAHLNNQVGAIVTFRGTKPQYEVAPCVPGEVYAQLQRLIDYAYQQSGVSALAAASQKPAGLNSGQALREYDGLQSDRFADLNKRYDEMYIELAYQIIDCAREIAERTGKYQTVYPNKDGTKQIDLPKADLLNNPFVIQAFDASALPKDPAGRKQDIVDLIQSGMISVQEGRRLLDYPDLQQDQRLAQAGEERILSYLDGIVEDGKYQPPDPFMDAQLAHLLCQQYYNLYEPNGLSEEKCEMLRTFSEQCTALIAAATPPTPVSPQGAPQALPEAPPTSPLIPNAPTA